MQLTVDIYRVAFTVSSALVKFSRGLWPGLLDFLFFFGLALSEAAWANRFSRRKTTRYRSTRDVICTTISSWKGWIIALSSIFRLAVNAVLMTFGQALAVYTDFAFSTSHVIVPCFKLSRYTAPAGASSLSLSSPTTVSH